VPRLNLATVADGEIGMNAIDFDQHSQDRADPSMHPNGPDPRDVVDQRLQNAPPTKKND
jgi:hypothetical protein